MKKSFKTILYKNEGFSHLPIIGFTGTLSIALCFFSPYITLVVNDWVPNVTTERVF